MRSFFRIFAVVLLFGVAACGPSEPQKSEQQPSTEKGPDANVPLGQLGTAVVPTHYKLDLAIRPDKPRYSGSVQIDVKLNEARRVIYLHGQDLHVTNVEAELADGKKISGAYAEVDKSGVARLTFEQELAPGGASLRLAFDAAFTQTPLGLTRQIDSGEPYAWTQFEAIAARKAFPCFDEPGFKTPFDIVLTARPTDAVISNTLPTSEETVNGLKRVTFATTAPLPTYLVLLAAGPYDVVDGPPIPVSKLRDHPIPLRGITVKGKGPQIRYALERTATIVNALEAYFGRPFPFPKLDLIAPPNFSAGGMENAGAITYAERLMLLDEHSPLQQQRAFYSVHAHELAHQWFGDLVTPKWWNDIWLNESFATWMSGKIVTQLFPKGEYDREVRRDEMQVMDNDALPSARSIRQEIKGTGDIYNAFDGLTYDKGAGVLSMFESYLGEDKFRDGVRKHMDRFAGGVADVKDFMESLGEGSGHPEIVPAFETFLNQPGVPLVRLNATCEKRKTTLELSQTPYGRGSDDDKRAWQIPVCMRDLTGKSQMCVMLNKPEDKLSLITRCSTAWMPNAHGAGYYRFALSGEGWKALLSRIDSLTPAEQISAMHSLRAGMRAGDVDGATYASTLEHLAAKGEWDVVQVAGTFLTEMRGVLLDDKAALAYRTKLRALLGPRMAKLGLKPKPREPVGTTLLRAALAELVVKEAQDPATVSALASKGMAYASAPISNTDLPAELRPAALWAAVSSGGEQATHDVIAAIKASADQQFRTDAAIALTAVHDDASIKEVEKFYLSDVLRYRERRSYLRALFLDPDRRNESATWLRTNFKAVAEPIPAEGRGRLIGYGEKLCSAEQRKAFDTFFRPMVPDLPGSDRVLSNTLESIDRCLSWQAAKASEVSAYYLSK